MSKNCIKNPQQKISR